MSTDPILRQRLIDWAAAYGGDQYRRLGYGDPGAVSVAPAGVPKEALETEQAVQRMEQDGRWKEARVLRAEYFMATQPEAMRLAKLRRLGLPMNKTAYYVYLRTAEAFLEGYFLTPNQVCV